MSEPRSKYGSKRVVIDNLTFDSKAEARRYELLKLAVLAGEIRDLRVHPRYRLCSLHETVVGVYVADFAYVDVRTGQTIVEDVKGVRTELYRWKRRHFEQDYNPLTITEIAARDVGR